MISWIVIGIVALFSIGCYTKFKLRKLDFQCKHEWKTVDISALINDKNEKNRQSHNTTMCSLWRSTFKRFRWYGLIFKLFG